MLFLAVFESDEVCVYSKLPSPAIVSNNLFFVCAFQGGELLLQVCFCVYCSNNTVLIFAFGRSTDAGACILSLKQPASIGRGFLKNTP